MDELSFFIVDEIAHTDLVIQRLGRAAGRLPYTFSSDTAMHVFEPSCRRGFQHGATNAAAESGFRNNYFVLLIGSHRESCLLWVGSSPRSGGSA